MPSDWYQGRAAIYELPHHGAAEKDDHAKRDGGELKQCAIAEGMETFGRTVGRRVAEGKTTTKKSFGHAPTR